jgi:S1-C subfamily serine protease
MKIKQNVLVFLKKQYSITKVIKNITLLKKHWLRILIYSILLISIIYTSNTFISNRNFYGVTLNDLARQGDTPTKEVAELSKTVVQICDNSGRGSGVIIYADRLFIYIMTNYHVIRDLDTDSAYVKFVGSMVDSCVKNVMTIAYEEASDLAIIVIPRSTEDFKIAEVAKESPKSGDEILNIGFPLGLTLFCSRGTYTDVHSKYFFSSDLATAPGASGSPIFNSDGKLIGLIQAINLEPLPKNKYWGRCEIKGSILYLVRSSIGINLKTIKHFLGNLLK